MTNLGEAGSIVAGAAIIGTVMGAVIRGWSSVKATFNSLASILVTTVHIEDEATSNAVIAYMIKNFHRTNISYRSFGGKYESLRTGKFGHIPFESFGRKRALFWSGWCPIFYNMIAPPKKDEGSTIYWGSRPKDELKCQLVFLRGCFDPVSMIRKASQERNESRWSIEQAVGDRRFFIKKIPDPNAESFTKKYSAGTEVSWYHEGTYQLLSHRPDELGRRQETEGRAIDRLYFPDEVKALINEIEVWRGLRQWCAERGVPWKRGWVLYGPPGTGKTALARGFAEDLDMPLFVFQLGELKNGDLIKSWGEMQAHVPCIALMEDFDNVFHGRENIYGRSNLADLISAVGKTAQAAASSTAPAADTDITGKLSFDCLLNCLDGADKSNGVFTIITTNHIELLDPAMGQPVKMKSGKVEFMSTRPGRIDRAIELGYMSKKDKLKLARRVFFDDEAAFLYMTKVIEQEGGDETPAQFQEKCAKYALAQIWEKNAGKPKLAVEANGKLHV